MKTIRSGRCRNPTRHLNPSASARALEAKIDELGENPLRGQGVERGVVDVHKGVIAAKLDPVGQRYRGPDRNGEGVRRDSR